MKSGRSAFRGIIVKLANWGMDEMNKPIKADTTPVCGKFLGPGKVSCVLPGNSAA
jgi:hypothetical protein